MAGRITKQDVDALGSGTSADVLITKQDVDALGTGTSADVLITKQDIDALGTGTASDAFITKQDVDALGTGTASEAYMTQFQVEVLGKHQFTQTGDGTLVLSGTAITSGFYTAVFTASGEGIEAIGGGAFVHKNFYTYEGSDGVVISGDSDEDIRTAFFTYISDGDLVLSGQANIPQFHFATGSVVLSGEAITALSFVYIGSGEIVINSSVMGVQIDFEYNSTGGLVLGGEADVVEYSYFGTGGIILSGSANTKFSYNLFYDSSGVIILNGEAEAMIISIDLMYTGSGNIILNGSANAMQGDNLSYTGSGQIIWGGFSLGIRKSIGPLNCGTRGLPGGNVIGFPIKCGCRIGLESVPINFKSKGERCLTWKFLRTKCSIAKQRRGDTCGSFEGAFVPQIALCSRGVQFKGEQPCERQITNNINKDP